MIKTLYAGYNSEHTGAFTYHIDDSHETWSIIHVISDFEMLIDNKWIEIPKNKVLIFPPKVPGDYRACNNKPFVNHWVSFVTDEKFITNSSLPPATPIDVHYSDIVAELFHMIAAENYFNNEYKEQSINHIFHLLFYKISESYMYRSNCLCGELNKIRFDMQSNPAFPWTISYISHELGLSPGYFQALYKKTFGSSCMEDVYNQRIELAKDYILHSSYHINEIAEMCGYNNTEHFCRQFRKMTGMSAGEYRKKYR